MIFLLQELIGALDTIPLRSSSMISGQGAPCFSCCEVKLIHTFLLPATLHVALIGLHVILIITKLAGSASMGCNTLCYYSTVYYILLCVGVLRLACVPLRPALKSQAGCILRQCCPCAPGCVCPVFASISVTATCQSSSHGTQWAASSSHQMPSQLLLAKLLLCRQSLPRQAYLLNSPRRF